MVAPPDRQLAIEARFLAGNAVPPVPETPMREAWGQPEDWMLTVGRHALILLPPAGTWHVVHPITGELVSTGFGPGEVDFVEVGGLLGTRRRAGAPRPAVDLDRPWFVRGLAEHEPLQGADLRVRLQGGGLDPRTPVRMAGTLLWRRAADLLTAPAAPGPRRFEPPPALPEGGAATVAYQRRPFTARLVVELGPDEGKAFEIDRHGVIGRLQGLEVLLADPRVSRRHAEIECAADGTWTLTDLGGANGTWVNAERLEGTRRLILGDRVRVGDTTLRFESGA